MTTPLLNSVKAVTLGVLGLAVGAMSMYVGEVDDAPGAVVMGMALMVGGVALGVRAARHRLPVWAARTALIVAVVTAAFAAFLTHGVVVTAPLFAQSPEVPAVSSEAPAPRYAAGADRARELVRTAMLEQNLPGVSVAVGAGDTLVWAEGFGWRDVGTRTPVTPRTRFNIGTAAPSIADIAAPLGLSETGAEPAAVWSPEAIGEPGEDFPPFTLIRHAILQPLGLAPAEYPLPGDRATFYVPRSDDDPRRGRRLMRMRDLACCADGLAFSSTPSDLVRMALATSIGSINGDLAGGRVMSLARHDSGIVVAVTSNIAHADTAPLAQRIGDAFARRP
ncbi:MAG: serine hydrolase [Acidobacteria bacterium]|nr:serine hydrolase [Acidobacteriota bacterium]